MIINILRVKANVSGIGPAVAMALAQITANKQGKEPQVLAVIPSTFMNVANSIQATEVDVLIKEDEPQTPQDQVN